MNEPAITISGAVENATFRTLVQCAGDATFQNCTFNQVPTILANSSPGLSR